MRFLAVLFLATLLTQALRAQEFPAPQTDPKSAPPTSAGKPGKKAPAFDWLDTYVTPNPVFLSLDQTPVFHAETTLPADVVELRVYNITLERQFATKITKPKERKKGKYVYEYQWKGARSLTKGVYFYLLRAARKGHPTLKVMKNLKIVQD